MAANSFNMPAISAKHAEAQTAKSAHELLELDAVGVASPAYTPSPMVTRVPFQQGLLIAPQRTTGGEAGHISLSMRFYFASMILTGFIYTIGVGTQTNYQGTCLFFSMCEMVWAVGFIATLTAVFETLMNTVYYKPNHIENAKRNTIVAILMAVSVGIYVVYSSFSIVAFCASRGGNTCLFGLERLGKSLAGLYFSLWLGYIHAILWFGYAIAQGKRWSSLNRQAHASNIHGFAH